MNEKIISKNLLQEYTSPEAEIVKISSVDIIRTSNEWDLPEIPIERRNPLDISI